MPSINPNPTNAKEIIWRDRKRTIFGLPLSFTVYELTAERLIITTGFLNTVENEVRLYRVLDLALARSLGQKIFGVGTIKVCSSDKSSGDFEIKSVKNSKAVKEILSDLVEKEREAKRVSSREYFGHDDFDDDDDKR